MDKWVSLKAKKYRLYDLKVNFLGLYNIRKAPSQMIYK